MRVITSKTLRHSIAAFAVVLLIHNVAMPVDYTFEGGHGDPPNNNWSNPDNWSGGPPPGPPGPDDHAIIPAGETVVIDIVNDVTVYQLTNEGTINTKSKWECDPGDIRIKVGKGGVINKGTIKAKDCDPDDEDHKMGGGVWIDVDCGGLVNSGTIQAGKGGKGQKEEAEGGWAEIWLHGCDFTNKSTGKVLGGKGGDYDGQGEAGLGGGGKLRVRNGNATFEANSSMKGGDGGDNTGGKGGKGGPIDVDVNKKEDKHKDAVIAPGEGGTGNPKGDLGDMKSIANVIDFTGIELEAGSIYWCANDSLILNSLSASAVTATDGCVTLSVAPGGVLSLQGIASGTNAITAATRVRIYSDEILLDPGVAVADITDPDAEVSPGCECERIIPTLTEWGLIIFCVLLFGWMAWVIVRRRRRVTIGV